MVPAPQFCNSTETLRVKSQCRAIDRIAKSHNRKPGTNGPPRYLGTGPRLRPAELVKLAGNAALRMRPDVLSCRSVTINMQPLAGLVTLAERVRCRESSTQLTAHSTPTIRRQRRANPPPSGGSLCPRLVTSQFTRVFFRYINIPNEGFGCQFAL